MFEYLQPVDKQLDAYVRDLLPSTLGCVIERHTSQDGIPNLKKGVALITVDEVRGAGLENDYSDGFIAFRKVFYGLHIGNWSDTAIFDLGHIKSGDTLSDTYYLVRKLAEVLYKLNIVPLLVGGSHDLTYPIYRAFDNLDKMVNLTVVDSKFDLSDHPQLNDSESFLSIIIVEEPNNLLTYCNLGYQTYFNSQEEIDLIENLHFESLRLGELLSNLSLSEPFFRDADIVSIDLEVLKAYFNEITSNWQPNGFTAHDLCVLARYAGISDRVSMFFVASFRQCVKKATVVAQMLWFFIEGVNFRTFEYPFKEKTSFTKYIVPIEHDELIFYKSPLTHRWWMEIPSSLKDSTLVKYTMVSCGESDYKTALKGDYPKRWWNTHRRNMLFNSLDR